jgi:hypothetical protein
MPEGLFLTIPCEVSNNKLSPRPIYMGERGYLCPFCGMPYRGYLPCAKHMGMFSYNGNTTCIVMLEGKAIFNNPPCMFCIPTKTFPNFKVLAEHVQRKHLKEAQIIKHAAKRIGESMLPQVGSGTGKRARTGIPFLTFEMLSTTPKNADIVDVKYDEANRFGPSVVLKLKLEGKATLWTVRIKDNPNYVILTEAFGHDEQDFKGKKIQLFMEKDNFSEQFFPRVAIADNAKRSAARG